MLEEESQTMCNGYMPKGVLIDNININKTAKIRLSYKEKSLLRDMIVVMNQNSNEREKTTGNSKLSITRP